MKLFLLFLIFHVTKMGLQARFERPNATGFDFSEWRLPCIANTKAFGFSEDDIMMQERYLRNNMPLIWEMAREKEKEMQKSA